MTSRTERLAAKYAAQGKRSATETKREKEAARTSRRSAPAVAEDPMDAMRRVLAEPRSQESIDRARRHQRSLPPLGGEQR